MNPFVNIHTHKPHIDNKEFIEILNIDIENLSDVDVSCPCSIGIHPWQSEDLSGCEDKISLIEKLVSADKVCAIGETGLDKVCKNDYEIQKQLFMKHIEFSEQYSKPLIIHAVKSYNDIIQIRKATKAKMPWIIHGFQANEQITEQLLKHDIYFSLGNVLFRNEARAETLLKMIPLEKIFMETDAEDLDIEEVYAKASLLLGIDIDVLRNMIFNNFVKIFKCYELE